MQEFERARKRSALLPRNGGVVVEHEAHTETGPTRTDLEYRLRAVESVLRDRERELLELKGPCSNHFECGLHYAHSGPCDGRQR